MLQKSSWNPCNLFCQWRTFFCCFSCDEAWWREGCTGDFEKELPNQHIPWSKSRQDKSEIHPGFPTKSASLEYVTHDVSLGLAGLGCQEKDASAW